MIERAATDWLFSIENRRSGAVAQNGLGLGLGWAYRAVESAGSDIPRRAAAAPQLWAAAKQTAKLMLILLLEDGKNRASLHRATKMVHDIAR